MLTMAVVVVAEPAVIAFLALVGQNLWFRLYHHHRTTWLKPATWEVAAGTVTSRMLIKVFEISRPKASMMHACLRHL